MNVCAPSLFAGPQDMRRGPAVGPTDLEAAAVLGTREQLGELVDESVQVGAGRWGLEDMG